MALPFGLPTNDLLQPTTIHFKQAIDKIPEAVVTLVLGLLVIRLLSYLVSWLIGILFLASSSIFLVITRGGRSGSGK